MISENSNTNKIESQRYEYFWAIYVGCLGSSRSLYDIQHNCWNLSGNPLYQKEKKIGMRVSDKMVKEGVLRRMDKKLVAVKMPKELLTPEDLSLAGKITPDEEFNKIITDFVNNNREFFYDFEILKKLFNENYSAIKGNLRTLVFLPEYLAKAILKINFLDAKSEEKYQRYEKQWGKKAAKEEREDEDEMNIIKAHKKFIVGEFAAAMKLMDLKIIDYVNRVIELIILHKIEVPLVEWEGWSDPVRVFDEYNDIVEKFNFNMLSKEKYHKNSEKESRL